MVCCLGLGSFALSIFFGKGILVQIGWLPVACLLLFALEELLSLVNELSSLVASDVVWVVLPGLVLSS